MIQLKFRAVGGAAGAPAALKSAEPAYNMQDGDGYIGYGDDGSGNATSIKRIFSDDFVANVPAGGTTGQVLQKASNGDGDLQWGTVSSGSTYSADGNGIEESSGVFSLNFPEISTGIGLGNYLTTAAAAAAYQPIDPDLTAIAGLGATGFLKRTGANAWALDTIDNSDISDLDAAKLTGTIDVARLPAAVFQAPIVASSNIASLTGGQQNDIVAGTHVVTTDGRRWVYSGSGSKTAEASYVEMADITPEWSVIANKPSFATVATSGAYNDLIGRPTLGTMAAQNASGVAITGGTISGTTVIGGTF